MSQPPHFESYLTSVVRPIHQTTREERNRLIEQTKFNLFQIPARSVTLDLLTDSGTGAISNEQLGEIITGDESYAGSESFQKMQSVVCELTGFPHLLPTHQGRGAENVLYSTLIKPGDLIPGNTHFDTTKGHIEFRKGEAIDCTIAESRDPKNLHPFKGNIDLDKLEAVLKSSREKIPLVLITVTCNSGGGQPVSLENIQGVKRLCQKYGVRLFFDIARFAENAWFIKTREPACQNLSIREIGRKMFEGADGVAMSAKKDGLSAMGGFLAFRDEELYRRCSVLSILFEGYLTYGGMSGGTMAAIAQGLMEATEFDYLETRIRQVTRFGEKLRSYEIPIVEPVGGHAVYVNAGEFFPHLLPSQFPAQVLAVEMYLEGGIRGVEIGTVQADRDPKTGKNRHPALELYRLAVPRRSLTDSHLDYVAWALKSIRERREQVRGLEITWEAPVLRHFTCQFKRI